MARDLVMYEKVFSQRGHILKYSLGLQLFGRYFQGITKESFLHKADIYK